MCSKTIYKSIFRLFIVYFSGILPGCEKPGVTREDFEASNLAVFDCWNDGANTELQFSIDTSKTLHDGSLTFGRILDYLIVYSGNRTARFINAGDGSSVLNADIVLEDKKVYSLFLTGSLASPETVLVEDAVVPNPSPDKYKLRVANMITGTGSGYTVAIAATGEPLASAAVLESAVSNKSVSAFKEFSEIREKRYDIYAINPGVDTIVNPNVLLVGERSYTISLSGQKGSAYGSRMDLFENVLRY